jgi:hypothetical protein
MASLGVPHFSYNDDREVWHTYSTKSYRSYRLQTSDFIFFQALINPLVDAS